MRTDVSTKPVLIAALGVALFSALDAIMKVISSEYPIAQATGMRYFAGAIAATIYYIGVGGSLPRTDAILRSIPRSLANLTAGACFFLAISRLHLVDAIVLTFLSPLFISFWGWILLRERLNCRGLATMLVGLVGVFVIVQGLGLDLQHRFDLVGFLAAISTAALYALSMVMTRSQSRRDPLPTLVLLPSILGSVFSALPMLVVWHPVATLHYLLLACVGAIGTAAYICLAWAYASSQVGRLSLLEYTGLIWGAAFGYIFFREMPSLSTVVGAVLIIGACLPAINSEPIKEEERNSS
ncbi:DMT family transporter [Agrobacterium vitis]|nr:DMT family transporter [Agrobacterium vitis]